ncbi:MAG TPA: class I SAM-dependent methyltransferase [Gemmataceae bacterium]|nr:class I SAM-dependent methyltransferase [Gemmataceae bacterium]
MGLISRFVFPWLCDTMLGRRSLAKHRRELLAGVAGDVLEIGFGTGLNLPHYPPHMRKLTAIDPNVGTRRRAQQRIQHSGIEVDRRALECERLPFDAGTFDCVVSSWTLCSIDDVSRALGEVYRVLRPGGRFLFLEHGLSPDPRVRKWQRRLNWLEYRLGGGCRLDRDIRALVTGLPFAAVEVDEFSLEQFPRTHGHMYRGVARK